MKKFEFYLKDNKVKCTGSKIHRTDNKKVTTKDIIDFILSQSGNLVFVSNYSDIDWIYQMDDMQIVLKNVRELLNSSELMVEFYHKLQDYVRRSKRRIHNINSNFFKDKKKVILIATSVALASTITIFGIIKMFKKGNPGNDPDNGTSISETYDGDGVQETSYDNNSNINQINIPFECGSRLNECQKFFEEHYEEDILIKKYAECYGVDYNLIRAIAYQESRGNHNIKDGSAIGIMQIEHVHFNSNISCKNYNTGNVDKIRITKDTVKDKEKNIQIGTMLLRNHLNSFNNNPFLALQAYNFGEYGLIKNVIKPAEEDKKVYKNYYIDNPSETDWLDYRQYYPYGGDKEYCEHVLRFCTDKIIIYDENGNKIVYEFTPTKENKKIM